MTAYYVDNGDDDGAVLGRSTGKIAFFGGNPVEQPTVTSITTTTATTTLLQLRQARIEAALEALNLVTFT